MGCSNGKAFELWPGSERQFFYVRINLAEKWSGKKGCKINCLIYALAETQGIRLFDTPVYFAPV